MLQEKLLKEIDREKLSGLTLREIGNLVGEKSAQKIKHHLTQLSKMGFIVYNSSKREIKRISNISKEGFVSLPIVGAANCGPANLFADENTVGYLKVSKKMVPKGSSLYILRANGNSMNRASVHGNRIEDGDFVIVDSEDKNPKTGDYVISIMDDVANIKKFMFDQKNKRIILQSESTQDYFPIFIHEDDKYEVSGKVVGVIKK